MTYIVVIVENQKVKLGRVFMEKDKPILKRRCQICTGLLNGSYFWDVNWKRACYSCYERSVNSLKEGSR